MAHQCPRLFAGGIFGAIIWSACGLAQATQACPPDEAIARIVSVYGSLQVDGVPAVLGTLVCPGDIVATGPRSRAAIVFPDTHVVLRIDQNTELRMPDPPAGERTLLDLLKGAINFMSPATKGLEVRTPFVNAGVEGTEFTIRVELARALISVYSGRVAARNASGELRLVSGQSAVALAGDAPRERIEVRPRDAVQWALYYPLVIAEPVAEARVLRASQLLAAGRVDEARAQIETVPETAEAYALRAVIAVAQNERERAARDAMRAVQLNPELPAARIASSYALQAQFDLRAALTEVLRAVELQPQDGLAQARLAELWLSLDNPDEALRAAVKAVASAPDVGRAHTVLGFVALARMLTEEAKTAFETAVALDSQDPLARLGLGLARIREGELPQGRREIEIAAGLGASNALIRSYLGKAYFDEKRDVPAAEQLEVAKSLDSADPTAWYYDALRKQTLNRPVEALHDLERSIELNDNRAVYRSRLLLDQDLAARSAGLARVYRDLGFEQLALVEGWKSLGVAPADYSGHRFLADSYSALPRHEIARVSELLQSQLLQPLNLTPLQPQLPETNLFVASGAGPSDIAFNEFNPLFTRDRATVQAHGVVGGNETRGDDLVLAGVSGRISYSLGQYHFETEGFRDNNDREQDIYNAFLQTSVSHKTSAQVELRSTDSEQGDLQLRFDPSTFSTNLRETRDTDSIRLGARHAATPQHDFLLSLIARDVNRNLRDAPSPGTSLDFSAEDESRSVELQHLYRSQHFNSVSGLGHASVATDETRNITGPVPFPPFVMTSSTVEESDVEHANAYSYWQLRSSDQFTITLAASADWFDGIVEEQQLNPKLGLTWTPAGDTTLRAAAFRTLKRTLATDQTLEPTQVAGFNQFYDDGEGTDARRYGVALDHRLSPALYMGLELSRRELEVPFISLPLPPAPPISEVLEVDWEEAFHRAYLYWTPQPWLALSLELQYEEFERDPDFVGDDLVTQLTTRRVPVGVRYFGRSGFSARLLATYVRQDGEFGDAVSGTMRDGDRFWVVDGGIGYRLAQRRGLLSIEVKNMLDETFQFQDIDPGNPSVFPERLVLGRVTLAF